jgi:hypothetical protein
MVPTDSSAAAADTQPLGSAGKKAGWPASSMGRMSGPMLEAGESRQVAPVEPPPPSQQQQHDNIVRWEQWAQGSSYHVETVQDEEQEEGLMVNNSVAQVEGVGKGDDAVVSCSSPLKSNSSESSHSRGEIQIAGAAISSEVAAATDGVESVLGQLDLEVSRVSSGSDQDWYAPASSRTSPSAVTSYDNPLAASDAAEAAEEAQQGQQHGENGDNNDGNVGQSFGKVEVGQEVEAAAVDPPRWSYMAHGAAALEAEVPESLQQMEVVGARSREVTVGGAASDGDFCEGPQEGAGELSSPLAVAGEASNCLPEVGSAAEGPAAAATTAMLVAAATGPVVATASPQRPYGVLGTPRATPEGMAWQQVRRSTQHLRPGALFEVSRNLLACLFFC